jgi:methionyl-tRNA formyltransferase
MDSVRIVFLGTPAFAVPSLRALAERFPVVGVVTQPERPAGRGRRLHPTPVKVTSLELGLPLLEPVSIASAEASAALKAWAPDLIVVAAYGQILRKPILGLPPRGCLNVHASLLPRWRGASPVQHVLLHGDSETGVTLMKMDEGLDTGPLLGQRVHPIRIDHTAGSLGDELADLGARLLVESLPAYFAGDLHPVEQDDRLATYAPRLKRTDGLLDPRRTAEELHRKVRAFDPWPGTYLQWGDGELSVVTARVEQEPVRVPPGIVEVRGGLPALATAGGWLILERVQLPGRKPMEGAAFLRGQPRLRGSSLLPRAG